MRGLLRHFMQDPRRHAVEYGVVATLVVLLLASTSSVLP